MTSSETSIQIYGKGGVGYHGGDEMAYKMTLPPDYPYGIEPETITDHSTTFDYFFKAIDIMANESQVLILINSNMLDSYYENAVSQIRNRLENDSYTVHPEGYNLWPKNKEAEKWVRAYPPQTKKTWLHVVPPGGEQK